MFFICLFFLCAEITAVAMLINYISGVPLWKTASLVIATTLIYTLYGGLRASILTDNFQFLIIIILLIACIYNIFNSDILFSEYNLDITGAKIFRKFLFKNKDKAVIVNKILYTPIFSGGSIIPKIKLKDCPEKNNTIEFA